MHGPCSRIRCALGVTTAALLLLAPGVTAQTGSVAGRVVDAESGQTVPAAQVFISDLDIGVLTQQNGSYILLNVPVGQHTVTVQRIGYREAEQTANVTAGETVVLDFRISEEALQLDEIIITGTPGGTQRRAIGNTVQSVDVSDVVQDVSISNFQDLLSGRTQGVRFTRLSGNVGTGSPISIRGVGSFSQSRNQPLVYVDGVRVNNDEEAGPTLGSGSNVNVLDDFNPEDIESVEIIKGPAAASLYGTEASAGVIQIITKKGQEGSPEFNISVRRGVNYMPNPAGRLGTMWTCPVNPAPGFTDHDNDPLTPEVGCDEESELVPYNMYDEGTRYIGAGYFDWPSENLYQTGPSQSYNLDVRGGTSAVRYFLSANYDNEEGVEYFNEDETFRLRGNVSVVFSENFSLDMSTGFVDGYTRFAAPTVSDGGILQDLLWSNGFYLDRINAFNNSGPGLTSNPRLGGFQEHLPIDVAKIEATRDYTRFTGSATINFTSGDFNFGSATLGLTSRAILGLDKGWDVNRNMFPLHENEIPVTTAAYLAAQGRDPSTVNWSSVYSETDNGQMTYGRPVTSNYSFDYSLTARLSVNDTWGFATSGGAQYVVSNLDFFENEGQGFASPLSTTINQISQANISTDYRYTENKSLGLYVQEEVSYDDRIFLTGAIRFDDNSTFGAEAPARRYPRLSGTWVVSEESFWSFDAINSLRLRGAWGRAGRQPSVLAGFNTYAAIPGPSGSSALRVTGPGNPGVEPEVSTELELGFDVALFNDRVSGEFTHYWRKDENALLGVELPPSTGIPGDVDRNLGRIDNWGWEATLSARLYESEALSFDLDLAADYTNNEIKELNDPTVASRAGGIQVGLPYPNLITGDWVVSAEFDPSAPAAGNFTNAYGQRVTAMCDSGVLIGSLDPDDATLTPEQQLEAGKYGILPGGAAVPCSTITDRALLAGRAFAPYTFSIAPRISLLDNQLQLFALAEGQYGRTAVDNGHQWGHIYNNSMVSRLENDAVWVASDRLNGSGWGWEKSLYDADFWKLREVGARYNLPLSWIERTGASRASLAVSARNIWTIWVAQDEIFGQVITDPEYGTSSLEGSGNYWETPALGSLNVTLRVTF